ncbi:MAG: DUF58 domain-containing protein [Verrucomicrobiaceae bacterium]|nr:DUF58 domain-containing protein [Verrucomicrobiaceae bacterium]
MIAADTPSLLAIHARARAWAGVMRLPFRQQRWRGQSGEQMGTGTGSSLDFQDHRAYFPGDDPRQINWQAYARTGNYSMKLYREEVRPLVDLILDVSASMFAFPDKEQRALELFAYAVEASLQTGATLRCFAIRGQTHRHIENDAVLSARWPQEVENLPADDSAPALHHVPVRAGAMRILISDLLFPADPDPMLLPLSTRSGRGIVFAPFSTEECDPRWDGNYDFIDAETTRAHEHRIDPELLTRYEDAYRRHFTLWKSAAQKHGIALARVSSTADFQKALQAEALPAGAVEM